MAATEPILNVPRSVAGVAALLILVQIVRGLLPDDLDLTLLLTLAFIPARYSGAALGASRRLSSPPSRRS